MRLPRLCSSSCYRKACTQWRTMITDSGRYVAFGNESVTFHA
ncbi:hypothetical protein COLSTE_01269 [Collinsella stercoris DSM 13279]|uniref:Uncharacterized protein n=1 Tax=Collinsella stercoris DSM 13279 TaxID=445975 RepID=B6GB15_9ACTN|nr:hypothetical protein COLSTE_01269 [Collinsella stercoris DSM 13279]